MTTIAVLGSANMDLVVRQQRLPRPGETIFGDAFTTVPGGKGLNQAVAAARLGAEVVFLGAVGDDDYGRRIRSLLEAEGIDTAGLATAQAPTGTAHVQVTASGENSIVVVRGANATITTLDAAQEAAIRSATVLVMQFELPLGLVDEAARIAQDAGVLTVLTPAPVLAPPQGLLERVGIVVPNEIEAMALTGASGPERAAELLSGLAEWAIVTLGAEGSIIAHRGEVLGHAPARPVRAVDTTAAGDTFVGGLIARLGAGDDVVEAVRWGTAAASVTVTREGATSSMPRLAEVAPLLG
ncbi:ribokinase [Compostimonas suwonensis]|uniref:Ribokinase n=1 Tax=Compostimonas suwonensis TaxID=1048394 RepID=A0A2M9BTZ7_9MICO|nr:ribokinase [Compostimonas suwonensis]PJJ61401.1 ribokinase [Compostimonas suwonensis]